MSTMNRIMAKVLPFIGMALFIVLFIFGLVLFSYILLIGAAIGLVLFAVGYVRAKLFRKKRSPYATPEKKFEGRVIEQVDVEEIEVHQTKTEK